MARPRYVDPATLGPRQVAGYFCLFEAPREHYDPDTRVKYRETIDPAAFDAELRLVGPGHPFALLWDHGMGAGDPGVPIGRSIHVDPDAYGGFCVVELGRGRLEDKVLKSARAREVGFSYHGTDMDPATDDRAGLLHIRRRDMQLKEISLTPRPAEPRAAVLAAGGPAPLARAGSPADLRDVADEDLIARAGALIEASGGSLALLELRAARERAAQRRRTTGRATLVRELAQGITEGRRRAAALKNAAAIEAARWPQDQRRPAVVITAEALIEAAGVRQAEEELAELLQNDASLIGHVMREARTA